MASKRSKTKAIDRYNSGVVFYNKREYTKAITEFKAAVDADSKNEQFKSALANSYNNRGVHRYEAKKYGVASDDFARAAKLMPKNEQYMKNMKMAEDAARKDELDKLCSSAYEAYNKKKFSESVKKLKEAAKKDPKNRDLIEALAAAYNGRGIDHYEKEHFEHAADDFEKAKQLWPQEKQYELNLKWTKAAAERKGKSSASKKKGSSKKKKKSKKSGKKK